MTALDAAIPLAFVAWALGAGLASRRRASRNLEEYFLAGRRLRGWQAGCSMAATQFAADTPLVVTGLVATAGLFSLWQLWSYGLAFLLLGFLFAPCWRRAGVLTDAELSELRYSGRAATWLRGVRALLFGVVFNCVVLAMVLFATSVFAEAFLHWDAWLPAWIFEPVRHLVEAVGVPLTATTGDPDVVFTLTANNLISIALMTLVALLYSTTGGLRSVVLTDVVQLTIMMVATLAYAWIAVRAAGGLGGGVQAGLAALDAQGTLAALSLRELFALTPGPAKDATAGLVAVFALQWLLQRNADGTGYLAQRAMACRSDRDARQATVIFAFLQVLLRSLLWVPLALALILLLPPDPALDGAALVRDREASFVLGIRELLPAGLLGLMLTAMLAALTSTVDTHLNWGSSYLANDIYGRLVCRGLLDREPSGRSLVWVARLSNLALLLAALLIMTQLESIQAAWKATLVLGAGIGVVTVLRWLWWRISAWGELSALVVSFAAAPVALAWGGPEAVQMLAVAGCATAAAVGVSLLAPATDLDTLREFVARARPPGFWGPLATGESGRALARALGATTAAAVSLFASLVGLLRLLVPEDGQLGRDPLAWLLLALAAAAAPLWLRALGARRGAGSGERTGSP
jgi:solute:Na+ symporter, SSS family